MGKHPFAFEIDHGVAQEMYKGPRYKDALESLGFFRAIKREPQIPICTTKPVTRIGGKAFGRGNFGQIISGPEAVCITKRAKPAFGRQASAG